MIRHLICLIILLNSTLLGDNSPKILAVQKIPDEIIIDGAIDPLWSRADSVSDFVQFEPYHGIKPTRKTVAKLLSSETALYCLMLCFDEKENIQQNKGKLDDLGGDLVSIMLDTFGNNRTAYRFAVSAAGVRSDARMLDDARNSDYSWDGIWFADARIYEWGYVVEMEIPYKSIQYDEELVAWGLDFDRWIPTKTEDIYWCAYEESEGQRISKFGKLLFRNFRPSIKGKHLEIYPVSISKAHYLRPGTYDIDADAGIDILYNPSAKINLQFTANPDFAQIEADPFEFNISRYETYYEERRPFFTEGSEIFMASGRQRNTGFYRPLELFYSRRIGKKLPDGTEVPLLLGSKTFGRIKDWEYGGFLALTGKRDYLDEGRAQIEDGAYFASARIKKQIFNNSSIGFMFIGKHAEKIDNGVLDIDGAVRTSNWQLAYQLARSYKNSQGDFAGSAGLTIFKDKWIGLVRGRYIGEKFDIDEIGFVPWRGTAEFVGIGGPRWYFNQGYIQQILCYAGPLLSNEKADQFTDYGGVLGFNMQFRNNWGYEINYVLSKSKELEQKFNSHEINLSSWFNVSPKWNGNIFGGYSKSYNFSRDYLSYYSWLGTRLGLQLMDILEAGTTADIFVEGNPDGNIEDITLNTRPYFSATPVNNLNLRIYIDSLFKRSSKHIEQNILGFLFSYNFSPKSWIYFAINEIQDRNNPDDFDETIFNNNLRIVERVAVLKIKYLYYF